MTELNVRANDLNLKKTISGSAINNAETAGTMPINARGKDFL